MKEPHLTRADVLGDISNPEPRTDGYPLGEHRIAPVEERIKAQFEEWMTRNALKAVADADKFGFPDEADKLRKLFLKNRTAGKYDWGGEAYRDSVMDIAGSSHLLFLLMRRCHPDITIATVRKVMIENPKDVGLAMRWAMGNAEAPTAGAEEKAGV